MMHGQKNIKLKK